MTPLDYAEACLVKLGCRKTQDGSWEHVRSHTSNDCKRCGTPSYKCYELRYEASRIDGAFRVDTGCCLGCDGRNHAGVWVSPILQDGE